MNKEQLIKEITDEVVKYVPDVQKSFYCGRCEQTGYCTIADHGCDGTADMCSRVCPIQKQVQCCDGQDGYSDITLEDILIAVVAKQGDIHINLIRKWELGKKADEQSVETLQFIRDILK